MRLRTLAVLLSLFALAGTAAAQDAPPAEQPATEGAPAEETGGSDLMGGEAAPADATATEPGAEEAPVDGGKKPISAGLLLGYGLDLESGSGNPWGLGFGLGGGYTLDMGLYLGARFVYYLGDSQTIPTGLGTHISVDVNIWELGVEGGYDIAMDKLHIRPGLGLGIASASSSAAGTSTSDMYLYVAPGAALLYDVSDSFFVGAEVRLQLVFADPDMIKALILLANAGMRF